MSTKPTAKMPDRSELMPCRLEAAPHPSALAPEVLLRDCDLRTQRRSGPGGQHRNKTSSGVFLTHRPSGVVAEATERRSQAQNREVALVRLRFELALEIRTPSTFDVSADANPIEAEIRSRYRGHSFRLNDNNVDKPAVLAILLNDLWLAGGQPSLVTVPWKATTSKLVAFLKSVPSAVAWVNRVRQHHGRLPLR